MKYIVFDLDETLGHFSQLGLIVDIIEHTFMIHLTQHSFNELCETYIQYFRPNLVQILNIIKNIKSNNSNIKVVIYTNNIGPKSWTEQIVSFLETYVNFKIFDYIVGGYSNYMGRIELCRTTPNKVPFDLINCINANKNSTFLFFDDQHHSYMLDKNITYIRLNPYEFNYKNKDIISLFLKTNLSKYLLNYYNYNYYIDILTNRLNKYNLPITSTSQLKLDIQTSELIIKHIKQFSL